MMAGGKRAVFAGCARNCANDLPAVLRNIERLTGLFASSAFVFVENDSSDATRAILEQWGAQRKDFYLIKLDGLAGAVPQRTSRLDIARNACVDFIRMSDELRAFDHFIVMDFDEVNARETDTGRITRAVDFLEQQASRAGVFANNLGLYNDLWALRHKQLCPYDIWEEVMNYSLKHGVLDQVAFEETFQKRMVAFNPSDDPIEVESAFNGFGIYKMNYVRENPNPYLGSKVRVLVRDGRIGIVRLQTCEHVHFNMGIGSIGGELFILPYLTLFEAVAGKIPIPVSVWRTLIF